MVHGTGIVSNRKRVMCDAKTIIRQLKYLALSAHTCLVSLHNSHTITPYDSLCNMTRKQLLLHRPPPRLSIFLRVFPDSDLWSFIFLHSTLDRYFRLIHSLNILKSTSIEIRGLRPFQEPEIQVQWRTLPRVVSDVSWSFSYRGFSMLYWVKITRRCCSCWRKVWTLTWERVLGSTPLHHAVYHNSKVMVRLLLKNGTDIKARDNLDSTALQMAASVGMDTIDATLNEN